MTNYKNMLKLHVVSAKYWFLIKNKMILYENGRHQVKAYKKLMCTVWYHVAAKKL
jgi:hypothetical protein